MNLLFCINGGYISPLLDCLSSIVLHGGEAHYDAYLLSSDLSEDARQTLMQQAPDAVTLHFIAVPRELFDGFPETERYPQEIYGWLHRCCSRRSWTVSCIWTLILL